MKPRQTPAIERWLIVDQRSARDLAGALKQTRRGDGVIVLGPLSRSAGIRLRIEVRTRRLKLVGEGPVSRVHDIRELRRALLARKPMILLSPIFPTRSHPEWCALPRMTVATMAQMAGRKLYALGGMNAQRYARIAPLGFIGWAGIDAWIRT